MFAFRYADHAPTWAPIERVFALVNGSTDSVGLDVATYMYMGAVKDTSRPLTVHLYKHISTRHYLNLDEAGHAYRFVASCAETGEQRYVPVRDLRVAIRWAESRETYALEEPSRQRASRHR
jgi:hypothetical protein